MDKKGLQTTNRISAIVEVISMLIASFSLVLEVLDLAGATPGIDLLWVILVAFIVFAVTVSVHISRLNNELISKSPKVSIKRSFSGPIRAARDRKGQIIYSPSGNSELTVDTYFAHVEFVNLPKYPNEHNHANGVVALLSYYGSKRKKLVNSIYGRWSYSPIPEKKRTYQTLFVGKLDRMECQKLLILLVS